jgi:superoxide dismutase, Cu-Zn family
VVKTKRVEERIMLFKGWPAVAIAILCPAAYAQTPKMAHAQFINAASATIGTATLTPAEGGVRIKVEISQLSPGAHAIHIHAVGKCERPAFVSAGSHFNPETMMHGTNNPRGPHAGDLPNFVAGANGRATATIFAARVTLGYGANSLFHAGGTALVIHEKGDDYESDPDGKSGARIACGVIEKKNEEQAPPR